MTRPGHASVMLVGQEMIAATKLVQATAPVWADATRDSASVQRALLEMTAQARLAITNAMAHDFRCVRVDKSLLWTTWPCDTSAYHSQLDYIACAGPPPTPSPTQAPNASAVVITKKSTDVKNESGYV